MKDEKESFMHYHAKTIFTSWLREKARLAGEDEYCSLGKISWRVNRGERGSFGVFEEYPLTENFSIVWDEQWWDGNPDISLKSHPDHKWMKENYKGNFKIADIVVQHKGTIDFIIEIVHKNGMSDDKLSFYKSLPITPTVVIIPAHWVMGQIKIPDSIPREFFI